MPTSLANDIPADAPSSVSVLLVATASPEDWKKLTRGITLK